MSDNFDVRLVENAKYYTPDADYKRSSWIGDYQNTYRRFLADPDAFWETIAKELNWIRPWDQVCEWKYPYARWFVNAQLNITANCLDRHVAGDHRNKVALIWRGEEGRERVYSYQRLLGEVMRFANGLKKLGVKKGDRVSIYMPMVPEQLIAMLACARIGAVHSVVFAGFGTTALNLRIKEAEAKVVITSDISIRRGKAIPLITIVKDAIVNAPSVEHVVIYRRRKKPPVEIRPGREHDFYGIMEDVPADCPCEPMDAEDPLFILYTSGSTGTPKELSIPAGATWSGRIIPRKSFLTSKSGTSTGARRTPAGSPATPILSMARLPLVLRCLSLRSLLIIRTAAAGGSSSRSSRSRCSIRRRLRSGRS